MSAFTLPEKRILTRLFILALVITLPLTFWAVQWKRSAIETQLAQQARVALSQAGLPVVNLRFEGRDAILTGAINDSSKLSDILDTVESVKGVRDANYVPSSQNLVKLAPATFDAPVKTNKTHPLEQQDLSKISFVYAQATLNEESFTVLNQLVEQLKHYPNAQVEIGVHTNQQGTALGRMAATQARAETITQYLIDKGIEPQRLVAKGYGATRPLDQTEPSAIQNRRVELTVLKE
ncbi:OmpA family protein [Thiolinea disciformis]|uniref:OmpA family protein n=1 Tax=Thiolinea disciformis TaxID=125614 RepID=UPI00036A6BE3|nr:OmpA family protein [Thiolinea disciformis]